MVLYAICLLFEHSYFAELLVSVAEKSIGVDFHKSRHSLAQVIGNIHCCEGHIGMSAACGLAYDFFSHAEFYKVLGGYLHKLCGFRFTACVLPED